MYVSGSAMYRSARTSVGSTATTGVSNDGRLKGLDGHPRLEPDWTGTMAASWETRNKHWSIQLFAGDLFATGQLHEETRHPSFSLTIKALY